MPNKLFWIVYMHNIFHSAYFKEFTFKWKTACASHGSATGFISPQRKNYWFLFIFTILLKGRLVDIFGVATIKIKVVNVNAATFSHIFL